MEPQSLDQLKADPKNPRYINEADFKKLKTLLHKFGDLSGIVKNNRTGELVGGHMRVKAFQDFAGDSNIQITQRFEQPTRTGTIAIGYVVLNGESYAYREVDWDVGMQKAANIAANRAGGDFDNDLLTEVTYELSQMANGDELLALTAMQEDEILKLLKDSSMDEEKSEEDDGTTSLSFRVSESQHQTIEQALAIMKASKNLQGEQNKDTDGNALYYICRSFLDSQAE